MYARIDRDYINRGEYEEYNRVGTTFGTAEQSEGERQRFRLLDDDREVYYGGESDDEALETVYEFGVRDAGAVILQQKNAEGEWVDVIG